MLRELRSSLRMLWKQPGFTAITVGTLAMGIGATAGVFSLIQGVLLTPPPYREPERLALISPERTEKQERGTTLGIAAAQWMEWQKESRSLESIAAYGWTFSFLILSDRSESIEGMRVTREYFKTMGIEPMLGRSFLESEGTPNTPPVIILGYDLWKQQFNGDPAIIGKTVRLSRQNTPPTVVGVMPPGVRFLPSPSAAQEPNYDVNSHVQYLMPVVPNPNQLKAPFWNVIGRLRNGVTIGEARAELATIASRQAQTEPEFAGTTPRLQPLIEQMNQDGKKILLPLLGASALVLLIACGNVAALLLVRGLGRQQEYAVRAALGAGRATLIRQVLIESLFLSILGAAVGIGLAFGTVKLFKLIGGHAIPRLDAVTVGWPALLCGMIAAIVAAAIAGVFPAIRASQMAPIEAIKSGGPNSSAGRLDRHWLRGVTMIQTALTLTLLVGAGLLIRTMSNLAKVESGYTVDRILTMSVTAVESDWADFHTRALQQVSKLPGVESAAFAWGVPLTGNNWPGTAEIEGQPPAARESDKLTFPIRSVTPDYFKVLGLPIAGGREFRDTDKRGAPDVGIVNQAFADRYFPGTTSIGRKIWFRGSKEPATKIVGIVANGRTDDLTQTAEPEIYLSLWQASAYSKHLVLRTSADPQSIISLIQRELRSVSPTAAIENIKTLRQIREDSLAPRLFAMRLLMGFSVVAFILTLVGIYGVLSLSVTSRRREIAIRSAVGASSTDIIRLVLSEGFRMIIVGVLSGLAASVVLARVVRTFLYGVEPFDPLTLLTAGILFGGVAIIACWFPARRAIQIAPIEALRTEG